MSLEGTEEKNRLLDVPHFLLSEAPACGSSAHFPPSTPQCGIQCERDRKAIRSDLMSLQSDGPVAFNYQFLSRTPAGILSMWTRANSSFSSQSLVLWFKPDE